jgi:hypothetical protein
VHWHSGFSATFRDHRAAGALDMRPEIAKRKQVTFFASDPDLIVSNTGAT